MPLDALGCVAQSAALGQAGHAILARMTDRPAGQPDKTAERGTVDDRAASVLAHVQTLALHASPDTAQAEPATPVEEFS